MLENNDTHERSWEDATNMTTLGRPLDLAAEDQQPSAGPARCFERLVVQSSSAAASMVARRCETVCWWWVRRVGRRAFVVACLEKNEIFF